MEKNILLHLLHHFSPPREVMAAPSCKRTVVIIHGAYGNPDGNWFPWLAEQVRGMGHTARIPHLPTPGGQNLETWKAAFRQQVGVLTKDTVLVGHSLGAGFILNLLEETRTPVLGTFLVSGFLGKLGQDTFDSINASFVCRNFEWQHIRRAAGEIHIYNSDNDPYVPLARGKELSKNLGTALTVIKKGGHINAEAGFRHFLPLLEDLRPLLFKGMGQLTRE